ncbi:tetratricopeptide repeat protein [Asanoa ferruginea]|uniref:Tetratricopeptide repeat protein n=1 Tax=Asanoa ferruginea TaxID=53367 RepID=A0A3D9ZN34_9ACTN|nr:FxSxx-COOH system tetratricopeptide repeat protein [Asanoa ferruginea]REF98776.1 tetratricopeptide repeat protein [Asanoa ferruginea]GIF49517.1 ATP-binding protein [Asanoa ferruginea]
MAIRLPASDALPDGPLREFVAVLHELYDLAGQPAARLISKDISALPKRFESVSHQTVAALLHGGPPPAWEKVRSIVFALKVRAELDDSERDLERRFKPLWINARAAAVARPAESIARAPIPGPRPQIRSEPVQVRMPSPPERVAIRPDEVLRTQIEPVPLSSVERIVGGLPDRDSMFTGRAALLDRMHRELQENPHAPVVLHGLSGVGKTQLAREYVERYRHEHLVIWWIQADQLEHARRSLLDLAERLGSRQGQSADQTIDGVISQLESQPTPYLLVFDGVSDEEVRQLMPTFGGHVIVTTRDPALGRENTSSGIEVPDFTVDEAVAFLRKRDVSLSEVQARELLDQIGRLPLALEHIAALRQGPGLSWIELKERLEGSPGVLPVIKVALDKFGSANPSAMLVLEMFAWFGSEPVAIALLRQGRVGDVTAALRRAVGDPLELLRALRSVQQYGLARLHGDQRVEVQPITRHALRDVLSEEALGRARRNAHEVLAAAGQGEPNDVASSGMHREIAAHVLPAELIQSDSPKVLLTVYHQIRYRYVIGDYAGARDVAESAVTVWREAPGLGPGAELVLKATHEWANALRALGDYQAARDRMADAMSRLRFDPAYGEDHPLTLRLSSSHASDLRLAGEYRRAKEIDSATLERWERRYGDDDPSTATRRHNFAVSLRHMGEFARAENTDRVALAANLRHFGADDWRTHLSVNALAEDLYGLGRWAQLLELQTVYAGSGRSLPGQVDRGALLLRRTLGLAQRGLGELADSLVQLKEHYRECHAAFGPDHEYTLAAAFSYANTLRLQGDLQEADAYAHDAVAAYSRTFGSRHPLTLAAKVNFAAIRRAQGYRLQAQQFDAAASEALRDRLGDGHPSTIAATANLATDYALAGGHHAPAARALSASAYARACESQGADHPDSLAIGANLALDLAADGRVDEAADLRESVLSAVHRELGRGHAMAGHVVNGRRIECTIEPPSA